MTISRISPTIIKSGLLNINTTDTALDNSLLWGYHVHCRMFSTYPLDTNRIPQHDNQKCLQTLPKPSLMENCIKIKNFQGSLEMRSRKKRECFCDTGGKVKGKTRNEQNKSELVIIMKIAIQKSEKKIHRYSSRTFVSIFNKDR